MADGVFSESKEFLAGFWIVDVKTPERECAIPVRLSDAPDLAEPNQRCPLQCAPSGARRHRK